MNRLNRKIEYSLMALKHMAHKIPGELTTAKEVSDTFKTPFDATARVMQVMANRGLLKSEHGAFGGYQITKDLAKISLHDLLDVIEGAPALVKCLHQETPCDIQSTCNIVSPISSLNQKLNEFYQGLSLKDLLMESVRDGKSISKNKSEVLHG